MGLNGIVIASTITGATMLLLTLAYARYCHNETRDSFHLSSESSVWSNWPQYFQLGLPGVFIMVFDNWGYQAMLLLSFHFGLEA